jgi:hypothetical protein
MENNYMDMMSDLMKKSDTIFKDQDTFDFIAFEKLKDDFQAVTDIVKETPIYKDNIYKINEFIEQIKKDYPVKLERCRYAYAHFLDRSVNAPTSLHLNGVVIFCIPIISYFLSDESADS